MQQIQEVYDHSTLVDFFNRGNRVKYIFFWGHRPRKNGTIGKQCFNQWFSSAFVVEGVMYPSAEHYMMAEKARLFKDSETLERILSAKNPGEAKQLGRTISGFSDREWNEKRKRKNKGVLLERNQNSMILIRIQMPLLRTSQVILRGDSPMA